MRLWKPEVTGSIPVRSIPYESRTAADDLAAEAELTGVWLAVAAVVALVVAVR